MDRPESGSMSAEKASEGAPTSDRATADDEAEPDAAVAGGTDRRLPVRPGDPTLEGSVFVLLGALVTMVVLLELGGGI